jgi:hypothetical protein
VDNVVEFAGLLVRDIVDVGDEERAEATSCVENEVVEAG